MNPIEHWFLVGPGDESITRNKGVASVYRVRKLLAGATGNPTVAAGDPHRNPKGPDMDAAAAVAPTHAPHIPQRKRAVTADRILGGGLRLQTWCRKGQGKPIDLILNAGMKDPHDRICKSKVGSESDI